MIDRISYQKLHVPCGALSCVLSTITGPPGDPEAAKQFLLQLFLSVNPDPLNKQICSHFIQAIDTKTVQRVFQDTRDHILDEVLKPYGSYNLM